MNVAEYLKLVENMKIDSDKVETVQNVYEAKLPELLQKIVSNAEEPAFLDNDVRTLTYKEILNAEQDLHVDFKSNRIIPVADCGDNDFAVYYLDKCKWSRFNIIDETAFKERTTLEDVL